MAFITLQKYFASCKRRFFSPLRLLFPLLRDAKYSRKRESSFFSPSSSKQSRASPQKCWREMEPRREKNSRRDMDGEGKGVMYGFSPEDGGGGGGDSRKGEIYFPPLSLLLRRRNIERDFFLSTEFFLGGRGDWAMFQT